MVPGVLWVGTKRQVKGVIQDAGQRTGMPIVTERWIGGTLTNFSVIRSRLKRLEELQAIAESFEGVEKSFAVQAGREVRILVRPEEIDDLASTRLARDIVRKIEETLTYPGQIKVTVIRETRAVEYAK